MLERMDMFFNNKSSGYEEHQLNNINSAREFYPFTASCLPTESGAAVLDLGCGTGLELDYYFKQNPTARIVGIDIAADMLSVLKEKFSDKQLTIIQGSYFDVPFEADYFSAAVSVESLHHFSQCLKEPLYRKLYQALKADGYFILTDYFALSENEEQFYRGELVRLKAEQGITDNEFYHYDTPLTVEHETEALKKAGFASVEIVGQWGATHTIRASK